MLAVSLATTAVGAGVQYFGQQQQAKAARDAANYNADIGANNAGIDRLAATMQANAEIKSAQLAESQARLGIESTKIDQENIELQGKQTFDNFMYQAGQSATNGKTLLQQARIQTQDAQTLNDYGRNIEAVGRERVTRMREDHQRILASARTSYAKSGVVMTGSPLDVMADTAAHLELAAQDSVYETGLAARDYDKKAANARQESLVTLLNAGQAVKESRNFVKSAKVSKIGTEFALRASKLEEAAGNLNLKAAIDREAQGNWALGAIDESYGNALDSVDLQRMMGYSTARGEQLASIGTLISGVNKSADTLESYYN